MKIIMTKRRRKKRGCVLYLGFCFFLVCVSSNVFGTHPTRQRQREREREKDALLRRPFASWALKIEEKKNREL